MTECCGKIDELLNGWCWHEKQICPMWQAAQDMDPMTRCWWCKREVPKYDILGRCTVCKFGGVCTECWKQHHGNDCGATKTGEMK